MRQLSSRTPAFVVVLGFAGILASGCTSSRRGVQRFAADHLAATATSYNLAIEQAQDEMLLLNVIRAKDHQPMYITDASKVTGTVKADVTLGLTVPFHIHVLRNATTGVTANDASAAPMFEYSSSPAMDVNLLNSKEFMVGFMKPIEPELFAYFWDQGWPSEFLFYLLVLNVTVYEQQASATRGADSSWVSRCQLHNHPDLYDANLLELKRYAGWVYSQVRRGRPQIVVSDGSAAIGPAVAAPPIAPPPPPSQAGAITFSDLVTVAKEPTLSLDSPQTGQWRLSRQKKAYNLIAPAADAFACPQADTATGEPLSWEKLKSSLHPNEVLMGDKNAKAVYVLSLRSPDGLFYYLGELARIEAGIWPQPKEGRALWIHAYDYGQQSGTPPMMPLFVAFAKNRHVSCPEEIVSVRSRDGDDYFIPNDPDTVDSTLPAGEYTITNAHTLCLGGRSMMALEMAAELIGLQKSAQSISTTGTVKVLGQ